MAGRRRAGKMKAAKITTSSIRITMMTGISIKVNRAIVVFRIQDQDPEII